MNEWGVSERECDKNRASEQKRERVCGRECVDAGT